jgi:hypothetical protein
MAWMEEQELSCKGYGVALMAQQGLWVNFVQIQKNRRLRSWSVAADASSTGNCANQPTLKRV